MIEGRKGGQGQRDGLPLPIGHHAEITITAGAGEEAVELHGHARGVGAVVGDSKIKDQAAAAVGGDVHSDAAAHEEHPEGIAVIEGRLNDVPPGRVVSGHHGEIHLVRWIRTIGVVREPGARIGGHQALIPNRQIHFVVKDHQVGHAAGLQIGAAATDDLTGVGDVDVIEIDLSCAPHDLDHEGIHHVGKIHARATAAVDEARILKKLLELHGVGFPLPRGREGRGGQRVLPKIREAAIELNENRRAGIDAHDLHVEGDFSKGISADPRNSVAGEIEARIQDGILGEILGGEVGIRHAAGNGHAPHRVGVVAGIREGGIVDHLGALAGEASDEELIRCRPVRSRQGERFRPIGKEI